MSVLIFGRRSYGRMHEHGGEYAGTDFFHIYFVPLIPLRSHWVTRVVGDERVGFPIRFHLASVIAAYLRFWAPIGAMAIFSASGSTVAVAASVGLVALSAWSWLWRSRRGVRAQQRSDFDRVALGTRCDPAWMTAEMRQRMARALAAKLASRKDARSPEDVARFGATDVDEALLAYGLLRLSAGEHREAAAAADRILSAAFDQLPGDGGPYRERLVQSMPELRDAVATAVGMHAAAAAREAAGAKRRWYQRPGVQLVGLLLLTPSAVTAFRGIGLHSGSTGHSITARELGSIRAPIGAHVRVQCDGIEDPGWQVVEGDEPRQGVAFCWVGTRMLPVISAVGVEPASDTVDGTLRSVPERAGRRAPWVASLRADAKLDAASYDVYLLRDGGSERRTEVAMGIAFLSLTTLGWVFWIRGLLRRRRAP